MGNGFEESDVVHFGTMNGAALRWVSLLDVLSKQIVREDVFSAISQIIC